MLIPDNLPRSCRYCAYMVCGDINYCEAKDISISDNALPKVRNCDNWIGNPMAADSFDVWAPKPKPNKHCEGQMRMEVVE